MISFFLSSEPLFGGDGWLIPPLCFSIKAFIIRLWRVVGVGNASNSDFCVFLFRVPSKMLIKRPISLQSPRKGGGCWSFTWSFWRLLDLYWPYSFSSPELFFFCVGMAGIKTFTAMPVGSWVGADHSDNLMLIDIPSQHWALWPGPYMPPHTLATLIKNP